MNFISGEKFQELADVTIALNIESNYASNLVKTQLQNIQTKCYVFDPNVDNIQIPNDIKYAKSIFVYTHILQFFFDKIFPQIESQFILITHNSDCGVSGDMIQYLESSKIKKWYCQNRYISHSKLFSLPIGIGNSQWPHGNQDLLTTIRNENNSKNNLVFKNFDISTNHIKRNHCNDITNKNGIHMSPHSNMVDYWRAISQSHYAIAPHGNGVDCHRIWECLALRTIPVVEDHECYSQFKHLPILFIDNWDIVTTSFLNDKLQNYNDIQINDISFIDINYFKSIIT